MFKSSRWQVLNLVSLFCGQPWTDDQSTKDSLTGDREEKDRGRNKNGDKGPSTNKPNFTVEDRVNIVPVNGLSRLSKPWDR